MLILNCLSLAYLYLLNPCQSLSQEWYPVGSPNITNLTLQTVGGISYITHTSRATGCDRISQGAVSRSGTNLFQIMSEDAPEICGCDLCVHAETHVSVLGALPEGSYLLQLSSIEPPGPFRWLGFSVPAADGPTLAVSKETNQCRIHVAGVPLAKYVVQSSPDLTNWTSVTTNTGAPFTWNEPVLSTVSQRFYRVRILGN